MPNTHSTLTGLFSDIADAIRAKTGGTADIVADDFPTAISSIPTGGGTLNGFVGYTPQSVNSEVGALLVGIAQWVQNASARYYVVCCIISVNGSANPEVIGTAFSLVDSQLSAITSVGDPKTMSISSALTNRIRASVDVTAFTGVADGTPITVTFYGGYLT